MCGISLAIIRRMIPIILLAEFFGAWSEIANLRNSSAVLPSASRLAAIALDQIATA
jgi:hypothetical protein